MAGVYFQIKSTAVADAVQCGMKLKEFASRELVLGNDGQARPVMVAWLHPDDLPQKSDNPGTDRQFTCLRLEVDSARCFIGDADLYRAGLRHPNLMQRYLASIVILRDYQYGNFCSPECLLTHSILDQQIEIMGTAKDVPVLFENSKTLYMQHMMDNYEEAVQDGGNALLFSWCRLQESKGLLERYMDETMGKEIFVSKRTGKVVVLDVPDRATAEVWP